MEIITANSNPKIKNINKLNKKCVISQRRTGVYSRRNPYVP